MISSNYSKKISIEITTYKRDPRQENRKMNGNCYNKANKKMCAICLNTKSDERPVDCNNRKNKLCPVCHKGCECFQNKNKREKGISANEIAVADIKKMQGDDVSQGLNLLNEVLTVLQNNKADNNKSKVKSKQLKDAAVATENIEEKIEKDLSRLTTSTFFYSIDAMKTDGIDKFLIINSCQPCFVRKSQYSIDLIKHKSSSIPQMKLEELKYYVKEKTKSKDTIDEVNRMFATVRNKAQIVENSNRPKVRNGPRVLPVVTTYVKPEAKPVKNNSVENATCRCCTHMSSGDNGIPPECCHMIENQKCVDVDYAWCCYNQNQRKIQACCHNCSNECV